jgi:ribonuclease P protein subunit RPR2
MKKNKFKDLRKSIALNRIHHLFKIILETKDEELCRRYIILSRKLCTKYNLSMPREYKRLFCKKCDYLYKLNNSRIRIKNGLIIYSCFNCKNISRFRIK